MAGQLRRPRSERVATLAFPFPISNYGLEESVLVVTHELGHALDEATGFGAWPYASVPHVSEYALTNWYEAFAEAFTAWLYPENYPDAAGLLRDSPVLALFEELAR